MHHQLTTLGPGKFTLAIDAIAYKVSLAGCDDETGSVDGGTWYGRISGPLRIEGPFCDISSWMLQDHELTEADLDFIREHSGGFIISEDDRGFVDVEWYADENRLNADWELIVNNGEC